MDTFEIFFRDSGTPLPKSTDVLTNLGTLVDPSVVWLHQSRSMKRLAHANAEKSSGPPVRNFETTAPVLTPAIVSVAPPMDFSEESKEELEFTEEFVDAPLWDVPEEHEEWISEPASTPWSDLSFGWVKKTVGPVLAAMLIGAFGLSTANAQPAEKAGKRVTTPSTPCALQLVRGVPQRENGQLIYDCGGSLMQAGALQLSNGKLVATGLRPYVEEPMPDGSADLDEDDLVID